MTDTGAIGSYEGPISGRDGEKVKFICPCGFNSMMTKGKKEKCPVCGMDISEKHLHRVSSKLAEDIVNRLIPESVLIEGEGDLNEKEKAAIRRWYATKAELMAIEAQVEEVSLRVASLQPDVEEIMKRRKLTTAKVDNIIVNYTSKESKGRAAYGDLFTKLLGEVQGDLQRKYSEMFQAMRDKKVISWALSARKEEPPPAPAKESMDEGILDTLKKMFDSWIKGMKDWYDNTIDPKVAQLEDLVAEMTTKKV